MIVVVCRFTAAREDFADQSGPAVRLFAAQPTCARLQLARSTDDPSCWVLTAEFDTVADYRRALSPFDVRTLVVPFLSTADQESSGVYEVVLLGDAAGCREVETVVDPAAVWSSGRSPGN